MDAVEWITPCPQQATAGHPHLELGGCRVEGGDGTSSAVSALRTGLPRLEGPSVVLRVRVDEDAALPAEGYTLTTEGGVLITGVDPAGAFYGAQTLLALAAAPCPDHVRCIPAADVRDWPSLPLRGTIEGFYGTPWTHADRLEHLRFSGRHKLNTYVYAPKDDPFHRELWREPYPEIELARLAELVTEAAAQHVRLVFALSPGLSMVYSDPAERAALREKAGQVWEVGVREFALLFDDIPQELEHQPDREAYGTAAGASASAHAAVCRDFAEGFLAPRGAEHPLTMVPTDYAGTARTPYRARLAAELPPDMLVWWTGSDVVVGEIASDDIASAAASYEHRLALWDNFPVNDFDFERVFLGPLVGRTTDLDPAALAGITANPMVEAAASQLALVTVADYAWNPAAYDPAASHRRSVRLTPGAVELLPLIEACSSWPPGADQSPAVSALCAATLEGDAAAAVRLREELTRLADLPADAEGRVAAELKDWVAAARDMGAAGLAALDLLGGTPAVPRALETLGRAEAHKPNVLRKVIPPFVRAVLNRAPTTPGPGPRP